MMAQREQHLLPERVIGGKYRIIRLLGEGGMGGVYEAENELTRKRVAIKWLHPAFSSSRDAVQRLLREAQACARVRHPNVVDVYDVGQEGDSVFLVMEYLEGETLGQALSRKEFDLDTIIGLLIPAMRGVSAAHAQGIVHRDIKPENIFLARVPDYPAPVPKVLDFGISKVDARQGQMDTLTQSGVTMGTPLYMSFEQLSGAKDADARSDVYAFGVILYEAATGQPPFQADSFAALAVKVATTEPTPPRRLNPSLNTHIEGIILKAMARERSQRFESVDALIAVLEPYAPIASPRSSNPMRARSSSSPGRTPSAFAATMPEATPSASNTTQSKVRSKRWAAIALALIAVVATVSYLRGGQQEPGARANEGPGSLGPEQPKLVAPKPIEDRPVAPPAVAPPAEGSVRPVEVAPAVPDATTVGKGGKRGNKRDDRRRPNAQAPAAVAAPVQTVTPAAPVEPTPAPNKAPEPVDKGFRAGQPKITEF